MDDEISQNHNHNRLRWAGDSVNGEVSHSNLACPIYNKPDATVNREFYISLHQLASCKCLDSASCKQPWPKKMPISIGIINPDAYITK